MPPSDGLRVAHHEGEVTQALVSVVVVRPKRMSETVRDPRATDPVLEFSDQLSEVGADQWGLGVVLPIAPQPRHKNWLHPKSARSFRLRDLPLDLNLLGPHVDVGPPCHPFNLKGSNTGKQTQGDVGGETDELGTTEEGENVPDLVEGVDPYRAVDRGDLNVFNGILGGVLPADTPIEELGEHPPVVPERLWAPLLFREHGLDSFTVQALEREVGEDVTEPASGEDEGGEAPRSEGFQLVVPARLHPFIEETVEGSVGRGRDGVTFEEGEEAFEEVRLLEVEQGSGFGPGLDEGSDLLGLGEGGGAVGEVEPAADPISPCVDLESSFPTTDVRSDFGERLSDRLHV